MATITVKKAAKAKAAKIADVQETFRRFIGKSWVNQINKPESKYNGVKYLTLKKDRGVKITFEIPVLDDAKNIVGYETVVMDENDSMMLFPNVKREGKRDADFRLSFVSSAAPSEAAASQQADILQ